MARSLTGTHEVLLLSRAGHNSAPTVELWSWAGHVPRCCRRCLSDTDGPQQQGGLQPTPPPRLPGPSHPSAAPGLDVGTCHLCAGVGGRMGAGKGEEGLQSAPWPAELPHAQRPDRLPSRACCSSARCGGGGSSAVAAAPGSAPSVPHPAHEGTAVCVQVRPCWLGP